MQGKSVLGSYKEQILIMEESTNWLTEHFSAVLGVATLSAVIIGVLGSAKLDPKADVASKDAITIDIFAKEQPRVVRNIPRVPNVGCKTFRVEPLISNTDDIEIALTPVKQTKLVKNKISTIDMVVDVQAQPKQARAIRRYKVRPGDTLTKISRKVYGSTRYWKRIAEANLSKIGNYHRLKIGQVLIIPSKNRVSYAKPPQLLAFGVHDETNNKSKQLNKLTSAQSQRTYTVQKNDTWWTIAGKLLGDPTKWKALKKANTSVRGRVLNIGTTLQY